MNIGLKEIGKNCEPYIIAEAGINHNGELEKAFKMIEAAKQAGVDAIKFQTFKAEEMVSSKKQLFTYYSQGKEITESMLEMFKRYEFTNDEWFKIKQKCDELEITFLSTPQNKSDLELLLELRIPAIKVGSDDFTHLPLLKMYAETGLPLLLSCGMSDLGEVYQALETIDAFEGYPVVLLLCTSEYPTPPEQVNLKKIVTLSHAFPEIPIGFSDHTQGSLASSVAVAFGACLFEKHFTLDNQFPGPDHWFSENPESLKIWANSIRTSYKLLGNPLVRPTKKEKEMRLIARRYIVAIENIKKGQEFIESNIGLRRTGEQGLLPMYFTEVLGKSSSREIPKGSLIKLGDFYEKNSN